MITQGVQDENNTVPLISGRWTAVRVRVESPVPGIKVTGKLTIEAGGKVIDGGAPINPAAGFTPPAPGAFQWTNEGHTLNFEVKKVLPPDPTAVFKVKVETTAAGVGPATDSRTVKCKAANWPEILYVRLRYGDPAALPDAARAKPGKGDDFLRATWPLPDNVDFYWESENSPWRFTYDLNSRGVIDPWDDVNALLGELEDIRQNFIDGDYELANVSFAYAWVDAPKVPNNGWFLGRVGFGNDDPELFQRTFAHELGHMAGLDHPPGGGGACDLVGWDVGGRISANRVRNPAGLFDFMVPDKKTSEAWVTKEHYSKLIDLCASFPPPPDAGPLPDDRFPRGVLFVQGVLKERGEDLESLRPVFRYPWRSQLIPEPTTGDFWVEVEGEGPDQGPRSVVRRRFDGLVRDERGNVAHGFFAVTVPFEGPVKEVRVMKRGQSQPLRTIKRTPKPPVLAFADLAAGAILQANADVAWKVEDPDSKSDEIQYHLLVSLDGGKKFFPVALRLTSNSFRVPWQELTRPVEGSLEKKIVLRLVASDGLNTEVKNLAELTFQK
jgi:hypothetical protein